jgi:high-affinity K+ transport system ATPase subunit B
VKISCDCLFQVVSEEVAEEKDEAMANAERELAEDAEWKRIQQNTFTRYCSFKGTVLRDVDIKKGDKQGQILASIRAARGFPLL